MKRVLLLAVLGLPLAIGAGSQQVIGQSTGQSAAAIGPIAQEFQGLHFRSIGPASMSGRIADLAVYEANPAIFYVGSAHSGVWKTTSNGALFEAQFQDMGLISIGDVTVSQRDPNLVWVGTGESNNRQSTSWGDGVYKSTNGGTTWQHMGLKESRHVNRIVIDPDDNNIVFVAATGPLFGSGGERGVYKTTDGGQTWKQVLKGGDEYTGVNDLVMAYTDRRTLFASTYSRQRSQCCFNGGSAHAGIWKSTDGGENWTRLTGNGLPTGQMGRVALDIYRRSANLVYALIETEGGGGGRGGGGGGGGRAGGAPEEGPGPPPGPGSGLYRSDDGGTTWRRVNANNPRPMYFSQVRVDANNPDRVYMGGVGLHMTNDGGQSMATDAALVIHDDIHAIWLDPNNSNHVIIGGDGGVAQTYDMSRSWIQLPNLPLALFYHVGYDMEMPYNVCGGLQDNYNWCGPSATRSTYGIRNSDWFQVQGGDGFVSIIDQRDSRIVYSESQDGNISRKNMVTGESRSIRPTAQNVSPAPAEGAPGFRFNWDTPMIFSPHDPGVLWVAANKVFRSSDKGDSWAVLSPDLTANGDRNEFTIMGVPNNQVRLSRNDGISNWPTIVALAESPKQANLLYTGTDDGEVAMSKDGGKTWDRLKDRMPGFPAGGWVSEVVPSRFDAGTVYVTVDAHRLNDYKTYIWASNDMGATFRSLNANLSTEVVKTLTEDLKNPDVLYIGTETGLFLSIDRGKSWRRLKANLPTVRIDEITIHPRDNAMILATHGRGVWILDHLEPIQEYAAAQAAASADAKLFSIPTGMQWRAKDDQNDEFWGHQHFTGENPPVDAIIQFYLRRPVGELRLKITDLAGKDIRDLAVPANRNQAGIQTVCWDMRVQPLPAGPQPVVGPGGGAEAPGGAAGGGGGRAAGGGRRGAAGGGGGAAGGGAAGGGAAGAAGPPDFQGRGGGGPGGGPGGGLTGVPTGLPSSGVNPTNPCGGGGGGGRGGGGGAGGGGSQGPLVLPGTYNVALVVDGKTVETRPMRVVADPDSMLTDLQRRRYYDAVMDLHEMQRRGTEIANGLNSMYLQMTDLASKVPTSSASDSVKKEFEALNKEFNTVREKFGVPPPAPQQGGFGGGGGGGGRGGGAPQEPNNLLNRAGTVKGQILTFYDVPSDTLAKAYADVKATLPKAIQEANAFLARALTVSQALKKSDLTLTVPAPVK